LKKSLVGVYLIQDGVFKFVNPRLAEIVGYDREEIVGKTIGLLTAPESLSTVEENIQKRVSGRKKPFTIHSLRRKKTGRKFKWRFMALVQLLRANRLFMALCWTSPRERKPKRPFAPPNPAFGRSLKIWAKDFITADEEDTILYVEFEDDRVDGIR